MLTSLVANLAALAAVVLVAVLMGFRSSAGIGAWLAVVGILALFTLALTWVAAIPGLIAKSVDGAGAFAYPLIFLPFISSAFVPTATMPGPVKFFAEHQPVTPIVNTIRALLTGQPVGTEIWVALAWCVAVLVGGVYCGGTHSPPQYTSAELSAHSTSEVGFASYRFSSGISWIPIGPVTERSSAHISMPRTSGSRSRVKTGSFPSLRCAV